jgi:hypothetical protein
MRPIEAELHQMLEEIVPNSSSEEQARIVAEAAAIFEREAQRQSKQKTAKRMNADMVRDSMMADALLQAIGAMDDWGQSRNEDEYAPAFVDGRGLGSRAIISQVSGMHFRGAASDVWGDMDILNEDLDQFLDDDEEESTYTIEDGHEEHCPDLFFAPGRGRHRSDSLSRN